jgi:alginate O-acetyltransferase complex protein AlgI
MLFNSWHFIVFLFVVLSVSAWLPRTGTAWKLFMVAASCYFYGQWSYLYLLLIFVTAAVDFTIAQRLLKSAHPGRFLAISIVANLGVLAYFKYTNFLIQSANGAAAVAGFSWQLTPMDVVLPVGISFYTFQNMSYTIDVYRGQLTPRRSVLDYALFTTFFPQLLAGPIVRASEFFEQLDSPNRILRQDLQYALVLICLGYVKKVVFADNLATSVDATFSSPQSATAWDALLAVYAFAFQIYFDFSGYTDIAIGLAMLFGFRFPKNFDYPYLASSFQEFWRRWHMTLSRWLRDYLYIALGGNRHGTARTLASLMTTMLLGGLWHGASWNFILWGGLHGVYLSLERLVLFRFKWWRSPEAPFALLRALIVFHFICFAWIFFRAADFSTSLLIITKIAGVVNILPDWHQHSAMLSCLAALGLAHWLTAKLKMKDRLASANAVTFGIFVAICVFSLVWFVPSKSVPFIYFQF